MNNNNNIERPGVFEDIPTRVLDMGWWLCR